MPAPRFFGRLFLLSIFLFFSAAAPIVASSPRLNGISPRGVQRGAEHTLRFSGERLADAQQVFLYDPVGVEILEIIQVDANNIDGQMKSQVPAFDQAFATLIGDLETRGLLDSTMACLCSEFGRTPKTNATAGRDHWPKVFSTVLAGGGIKRGLVYGQSNATASEPETDPLTVEDWATTIYHCMGIVADKELMAPGDRPIEIVNGGKVRTALLA